MNIIQNFRDKGLSPRKAQQIKLQQQCLFYTQRYEKLEVKNADAIKQNEYMEHQIHQQIEELDRQWDA